ncbi:Histone H1.8 [Vulpes lagopus]|uniref:histone H1.8-like n=1 Tax=Vulpes lagopus TaxID=494514 RepID=UPI001BCA19BB|nr:histone H1.8-like [Vulpes lagopus]
MAPGSIASSDISTSSTSSTSTEGSSVVSGSEKPGPSRGVVRVGRRHPPVLRMVLEALQAGEQRRGTSVAAIKVYILQKYPTVDVIRLKYLLKQALATGMHRGLLVRPTNSKAKGATGSFKLVPKHKRKVQPRKTSTMTAPRRPGEGKEEVPKKPKEAKKDPPNPDKVKRGPRKPEEARTAPPKPGGETHRKTKAGSQNSKSTIPKGTNGAASPAKKENRAPKEVAHAAKEGPKAKAAAPPNGGRSKTLPEHLARKTEVPRGPRRAGMPTKSSSSKLASRKTETES